jgi:hypothetical protein
MDTATPTRSAIKRNAIFFTLVIALIAAAIVRSSITTSLDSFTFDEAYHVGAGASYIQTGDFRLNPEQPPLTKLWVGAYVSLLGYEMSPFRSYADKNDERRAVEEDAYFKNDPDVLQQRTRAAMFALNALLIFIFALAVRRVFGDVMSIGATALHAGDDDRSPGRTFIGSRGAVRRECFSRVEMGGPRCNLGDTWRRSLRKTFGRHYRCGRRVDWPGDGRCVCS